MRTSVGYHPNQGESRSNLANDPAHGTTSVDLTGFDPMGGSDVVCDADKQ